LNRVTANCSDGSGPAANSSASPACSQTTRSTSAAADNSRTLAHLTHVSYNPDGTAEILVVGGDRYRIQDVDHEKHPYMTANVSLEPLEPSDPQWVRAIAEDVIERFLGRVEDQLGDVSSEVPDEPLLKASFVAANLRLPGLQGQRVLEAKTLLERFEILAELLGSESRVANSFTESTRTNQRSQNKRIPSYRRVLN
jgi:Lon protease-like protein